MEALALYEFNASGEDELSFRKGDVLKILGSDENWYKAELHGSEGYVPRNYVDLHRPRWFCENISRAEAESLLIGRYLGSFIIRASQTSKGEFSISVRHEDDVQHFKVMRDNRGNYYLWTEKFKSLNKLVEYYKTASISRQKQIYLREEGSETQEKPLEKPAKDDRLVGGATAERLRPPTTQRGYAELGSSQYVKSQYQESYPETQHQKRLSQITGEFSKTIPPYRGASNVPPRQQVSPPRQRRRMVQALYDFQALEPDELGFQCYDIIEVLDCSDPSWWMGQMEERIGLFPSNYVTIIDR